MHRAAKGNVRAAILALLAERQAAGEPAMHGYEMMQELSSRTGGAWRPSPGSIYPTLQMLEDEGLVVSRAPDGKRLFELTDAGREEFAATRGSKAPWEEVSDRFGEDRVQLKITLNRTMRHLMWGLRHGNDEQRAEVIRLLGELTEKLAALFPDGIADDELADPSARRHGRRGGRPEREGGFGRPSTEGETFDV